MRYGLEEAEEIHSIFEEETNLTRLNKIKRIVKSIPDFEKVKAKIAKIYK